MDGNGQLSAEFVMILGIVIVTSLIFGHACLEAIEINTCMALARNGVTEGSTLDSLAFYPSLTFEQYSKKYLRLKTCSKVVYVGTKWLNCGYDSRYKKIKILLQVRASIPYNMDKNERNCQGDRINYYVRKNICKAYKTENLTNIYYNPAFSDSYYFTTSEVEWV